MGDFMQQKQRKQNQLTAAVCVRNAHKAYGRKQNKNVILDGLNMTVPKNTIYGLLGSSGCGKTTLLSCIVGRRLLDSGDIFVLGGRPGTKESGIPGPKIGYMPQEISLYGEFTIRETIRFFGRICGMTIQQIDEKLIFLNEFLQLPSDNSFVRNLSGGQQRRVSLCASIVHDPELLILDEPTVGVDPILRQSIWDHLVDITKNGNTTIILTTHYIDEMKQADYIALMRGGYCLAEDTPQNLMNYLGTDNLEDAYLKLSVMQNKGRVFTKSSNSLQDGQGSSVSTGECSTSEAVYFEPARIQINPSEHSKQATYCNNLFIVRRHIMNALIWKHLLWLWRNKPVIVFVIFLPLLQMSLFATAIGGDPKDVLLTISNHELKDYNSECPVLRGCNATYLSCRFLKHLQDKNLLLKYCKSDEEADSYVKKGKAYASLSFPANYSLALMKRIQDGRRAANWNVEYSLVTIYQDKSNQQIALLLWKQFYYIYLDFIQEYLMDCKYSKKVVDVPIKFNKPIYGGSETNYSDFAVSGAVLTMSFFLAMAVTAGSLIVERKEGIFERVAVSGVTEAEILLSHVCTDFLVVFAQNTVMLVVTFVFFSVTNEGSMTHVFFLTIATSVSGMAYGYSISCFCKDEQAMTVVSLGLFYPVVMLCGMIWPREAMYYPLQYTAYFLPLTFSVDALRAILQRGWGMDQPMVYKGFYFTFAWAVFFMVLNIVLLKVKKN